MPDYTRLTINVSPETLAAIRALADRHGVTHTEAVRRAVRVYQLVDREISQGGTILIKNGAGTREVVIL